MSLKVSAGRCFFNIRDKRSQAKYKPIQKPGCGERKTAWDKHDRLS